MHMRLIIRSGSVLLSLLGLATVSVAQPSAKSTPTPDPSPSPIRIVYTGKFLGYLRVPSLQPLDVKPNEIGTCPAISANDDSRAATKLFMRDNDSNDGQDSKWHDKFDNAIRVSTGDNFAPQLEARVFRLSQNGEEYIPGNKERWDWFRNQWVRADKLPPAEKQVLENEKAHGYTTVPTDNVACFLSRAGYSAVVPGKHDFYFGAERVRELARFMATIPQPVQMLGANLVIKTSPIESPPSSAQQPKWPDGSTVEGLKENKPIYPWFSPQLTVTIPVPAEKIPVLAECVKGSKSLNQTALGQC